MYGETPIEIAADVKTRNLLIQLSKKGVMKEGGEAANTYNRTVVKDILLHNNRADTVKGLLFKIQILTHLSPATARYNVINQKFSKRNSSKRGRIARIIEAANKLSKVSMESVEKHVSDLRRKKCEVGLMDFDVLEALGKGSFGQVYLVRYRPRSKLYAMKVLSKKKFAEHNILAYAVSERNILSKLNQSFTITLDFAFQTAEQLFLVTKYCPGYFPFLTCSGNLKCLLHKQRVFQERRAKEYAAEVLLALEELHKVGIVYRDLKLENVVVDEEGHATLIDFGLAREKVADSTVCKSFCGSRPYLAPEIIAKKGYSKSVDWYAFGVMIYEMLTGRVPFMHENE
eukprot:TRINITY_DN2802_c0_g1_i2.p1 TRINITY_DN2802_c0_g1~~TRINITY_DN2802_c0_g1_i2.p1  ORF type:complete len:343 (+),score=57.06 TRINITY_DN2802_c0_g1_i2:122-1150(+)